MTMMNRWMPLVVVSVVLLTLAEGRHWLLGSLNSDIPEAANSIDPVIGAALKRMEQAVEQAIPIGSIVPFAGESIPEGWLSCDGRSFETTHPLFGVIGYRWGKDSESDRFLIPDLRGRFLRGIDGGTERDPEAGQRTDSNGEVIGDQVGSLQDDSLAKHYHDLRRGDLEVFDPRLRTHQGAKYGNGEVHGEEGEIVGETDYAGLIEETRPKNASVNWIIRVGQ